MVAYYGMSKKIGPISYYDSSGTRDTFTKPFSEQTARDIDTEVRRIIDEQYALARRLIEEHSDKMHAMAKAMLDWETIDAEQLEDIMAGREPRPPKDWTPRTPSSGGDGSSGGTPAVKTDPAPTAA